MDLLFLPAAISIGFGIDFDSETVESISGSSKLGSFYDHNSDFMFHAHVYYTPACKHVEHSTVKHQEIQKLPSPYGHGRSQTRLLLFASLSHSYIYPSLRTNSAWNKNITLTVAALWDSWAHDSSASQSVMAWKFIYTCTLGWPFLVTVHAWERNYFFDFGNTLEILGSVLILRKHLHSLIIYLQSSRQIKRIFFKLHILL